LILSVTHSSPKLETLIVNPDFLKKEIEDRRRILYKAILLKGGCLMRGMSENRGILEFQKVQHKLRHNMERMMRGVGRVRDRRQGIWIAGFKVRNKHIHLQILDTVGRCPQDMN